MADRAIGKVCPNDGTLTACAGNHEDEVLIGSCSYCNGTVTAQNYNIVNGQYVPVVAPPKPDEDDGVVRAADVEEAAAIAEQNAAPAVEPQAPTAQSGLLNAATE